MTRNWRLHYIQSLTLYNKDSIKFQVIWLVQLITWSLTSCFWQKEWIFDPVLFRLRIYFYQGGITTIAISLQFRILAMLNFFNFGEKFRSEWSVRKWYKLILYELVQIAIVHWKFKLNCNSLLFKIYQFKLNCNSLFFITSWLHPDVSRICNRKDRNWQ